METNNSRLDPESTDNAKDKKEAKIGIFLFITVSLLYLFFLYIGTSPLLLISLPLIIGFGISKVFFGIGFDDFFRLFFGVFETLIGIGIILAILLGILLILYSFLKNGAGVM